MTRIDLTDVAYDAKRACFRGKAVFHEITGTRSFRCRWHGPESAEFEAITQGLAMNARKRALH